MSAVSEKTRNQMKRMVMQMVKHSHTLRKMMRRDNPIFGDDPAWRKHAYAELLRRRHARH